MAGPGRALLNYGPVCLSVEALRQGEPCPLAARAGALRAAAALDELVPHLPTARLAFGHHSCSQRGNEPEVLRLMIEAVKALNQPEFTPMAAVAGVFSHLACLAAAKAGAKRVIVNNGGDIAMWDADHGVFRVGLVEDLASGMAGRLLVLAGKSLGVATSGLGGRSLTKGIASAVTCWAKTCPPADAAATCIANATGISHPLVETAPAEALDPLTDIRGQKVVVSVGKLPDGAVESALAQGVEKARQLVRSGLIQGCVLFAQGRMRTIPAESPIYPLGEEEGFAPRNTPVPKAGPVTSEEDHESRI